MKKKMTMLMVLFGGIGLFALPVATGGWLVITVDTLPTGLQAGQDVNLDFWVRQHGQTLTHDLTPAVNARNSETGERIRFEAEKMGQVGLFRATLNFPSSGEWRWSISSKEFPQVFKQAPLKVVEPQPALSSSGSPQGIEILPTALRITGLILLTAAGLAAISSRQRKQRTLVTISGD